VRNRTYLVPDRTETVPNRTETVRKHCLLPEKSPTRAGAGGFDRPPIFQLVPLPRVTKVICYVVRDGDPPIFRHRDHPDAAIQVPAGTVRTGEDPATAAIRETEWETGRRGFRLVRGLGMQALLSRIDA
jgi:hypothetical protein